MSCIGIDVGQQNAVVAIARRGGIDVLSNEVSKRLTAAMVGFSGKERKLGEAALSGITSNLKNTITGPKAIIGKKFNSESIQKEIDLVGYKMVDQATNVGIPVNYNDEEVTLTPEAAMSMVLKCMRKIAEEDQNAPVTDVVISVPAYFTDAERHAMMDAAAIAGLNCLRLMNDCTAAALSYGIYKTDMPTDKPLYVAFVDMGAMDTTVSIVAFVKGKLTVLATACERAFGGRDFDMILAEHFAAEWKTKHGIDAKTNKKAMYRLVTACEKTKKVLSANPQAPINIECFMEDIDVKGNMERSDMLTVGAPLLEKLDKILGEAFTASGLTKEDIDSVEIFGGSVRIPAVHDRIAAFFGKANCSKTLNFDECVAKGCALQCAMLSPAFKVREFSVNDVTLYPIALQWKGTALDVQDTASASKDAEGMEVDAEGEGKEDAGDAGDKTTVVFSKFNGIERTKLITLPRSLAKTVVTEGFQLTAAYPTDTLSAMPNGFPPQLAKFIVKPSAAKEEGGFETTKIKVKVALDKHGILSMESATAIQEQEVPEVVEEAKPETPAEQEAPAPAPPSEVAAAEGAEGSAAAPEGTPDVSDAPPPEPEKKAPKKKIKKVDLEFTTTGSGITPKELMEAQEREGNMAIMDKLLAETSQAMNDLESSVYSLRDAISGRLSDFLVDADKEALGSKLTKMEDWLYDEGFDADKATYEGKLKEIKGDFADGEGRALEADKRPDAINALDKAIEKFTTFAQSADEAYAHIDAEEKKKAGAEAAAAQAWLTDAKAKIDATPKTADVPVKAAEIDAKFAELAKVCDPIMSTPKPTPMEQEPPAPPAEPSPAAPAVDADGNPIDPPPEGTPSKEDVDMEGAGKEPIDMEQD